MLQSKRKWYRREGKREPPAERGKKLLLHSHKDGLRGGKEGKEGGGGGPTRRTGRERGITARRKERGAFKRPVGKKKN